MNLYTYTYNGIEYEFRMSNNAKVAIEEAQDKAFTAFSEDPETAKLIKAVQELENATDEEKKARAAEYALLSADIQRRMEKAAGIISPIELGYILLHSRSKYSGMTKKEYDALVEDMEEELGFVETQRVFRDMHDKVFSMLKDMEKKTTKSKKKMN